jgi:ribonuclease Z
VTAGLVSHRIPCFSFIVKESSKTGPLLPKICKDLNVHFSYFKDLKNGIDVTLEDGRLIRSKDVTGDATQGRKLVIVGDTCDATGIVKASMNCDLLIHEATLDNCRETTAVQRGHSTPSMAVEMAKLCNAKRLALNHIGSQFLPFHIEKDIGALDKRTDRDLLLEVINFNKY